MAFPLSIIGARLYYVIFKFDYYSQHLGEIFAVWNGGLAIYGGLITGAIVLYIFRRPKINQYLGFLGYCSSECNDCSESRTLGELSLTKKLTEQL